MNVEAYFQSVTLELKALKDRVRHLIRGAHWPTDGEWKESVLRSVLRRSAPCSVTIGRGFVVDGEWASPQTDILVYDNSYPILYQDGDLVFVTPASCRAIIEVKTSLTPTRLAASAEKLATCVATVRRAACRRRIFAGLFAYEAGDQPLNAVLESLHAAAAEDQRRVVDHVSIGPSTFAKFWECEPGQDAGLIYDAWHLYELNQMAPGYFIHNLLMHVSPRGANHNNSTWFPDESKEAYLRDSKFLSSKPIKALKSATLHKPKK